MSSKRVWAVRGQYPRFRGTEVIEHQTLEDALEDSLFNYDSGYGSSLVSYVVPV